MTTIKVPTSSRLVAEDSLQIERPIWTYFYDTLELICATKKGVVGCRWLSYPSPSDQGFPNSWSNDQAFQKSWEGGPSLANRHRNRSLPVDWHKNSRSTRNWNWTPSGVLFSMQSTGISSRGDLWKLFFSLQCSMLWPFFGSSSRKLCSNAPHRSVILRRLSTTHIENLTEKMSDFTTVVSASEIEIIMVHRKHQYTQVRRVQIGGEISVEKEQGMLKEIEIALCESGWLRKIAFGLGLTRPLIYRAFIYDIYWLVSFSSQICFWSWCWHNVPLSEVLLSDWIIIIWYIISA